MQLFTTLAAFLTVSSPTALAAEAAGRVASTTIATTTNPTSTASLAAVNACGTTYDACPSCDGQNIKDTSGNSYTIHCDSIIASSDQYEITNGAAINTTNECMEACDTFKGCLGAYFLSGGSCVLANGSVEGVIQQPGYDAFVRAIATHVGAASSSSTTTTTILGIIGTAAYFQPTGASAVSPPYSNLSTSPALAKCLVSNIICPACDGEEVIDDLGKAYTVYCDNQVFADNDYNVQRWTSPQGCLTECDAYSWCMGSTFGPQGNCQLAKGGDVFPQQMPGYTAFLPVANKTAAPVPTSPSRYPTANGYSAVTAMTTAPPSTFATITSAVSQPSSKADCNPDIARCPACEGDTVTDWLNQTYTISCTEVPICGMVVNRANHALQLECLEYCDADPVCFAATWESGRCDLCQESLEGRALNSQGSPPDYVMYYPVSPNATASRTALTTHSRSTSHTYSHSSTRAVSHTSSSSHTAGVTFSSGSPSAQHGITGTVTTLPIASKPTAASAKSSSSASRIQQNTFITAPAPSSTATMVVITSRVTALSAATSVTSQAPSTTSSASFVPPLTDGSVSLATPGGQTRV